MVTFEFYFYDLPIFLSITDVNFYLLFVLTFVKINLAFCDNIWYNYIMEKWVNYK